MPVGYTPIFRIEQEGIDITSRFNDRLTEIEVTLTNGQGQQDTCEITLDDREWKIASPTVGRKLEIYLGYKEVGLAQQNVFTIKTVEYLGPPRSIKITGTATDFIGTLKQPRVKEYEGKTLKEVIESIAKEANVTAMVEQGLGEIRVPFMNQTQSSVHLLQELERRYGAIAQFDSGKLIFIPRDANTTANGISLPALLLKPEHLAKWSVRHDKRNDFTGARGAYIDPDTHQPVWIEEQNPRAETDPEYGRPEKNPYRFPKPFVSEEEARAGLKSAISTMNRSLGECNLVLSKGDPWIRGNQLTLISGMRDGINGVYISETVKHTYTKGTGLLTTIMGKPPGGETSLDNGAGSDEKVFSPKPGEKMGERFIPPTFDNT
jgi:phage protein D